jgi:hypothetical protein
MYISVVCHVAFLLSHSSGDILSTSTRTILFGGWLYIDFVINTENYSQFQIVTGPDQIALTKVLTNINIYILFGIICD